MFFAQRRAIFAYMDPIDEVTIMNIIFNDCIDPYYSLFGKFIFLKFVKVLSTLQGCGFNMGFWTLGFTFITFELH